MDVVPHVIDAVIEALFDLQPSGNPNQHNNEVSGRGFSRIPFRGRAIAIVFPPPFTPLAEPMESEVLTTDISRSGLSVLHQTELYPGQQVLLQLSRGNCTVEVCWCCQVWPGLYVAGCRFIDATLPDSIGH